MRTGELSPKWTLKSECPETIHAADRGVFNEVLATLDREFAELYTAEGRQLIAPERLLRAISIQAFYNIR